jgi:hypothetical protein
MNVNSKASLHVKVKGKDEEKIDRFQESFLE